MTEIPEVRICLDENHPLLGAVAINFHEGRWQVVHNHDSHNADGGFVEGWAPMKADRSAQVTNIQDLPDAQPGAGTLGATVEARENPVEHLSASDE